MTVNECIAQAKELRLNTMTDEAMENLLREWDGQFLESMRIDADFTDREGESWPDKGVWPEIDPELLLPAPHEMVYVYYLVAQIDYNNQEYEQYMNDVEIYNASMKDAMAWWRRNHRPKDRGNWRVW